MERIGKNIAKCKWSVPTIVYDVAYK